MKQGDQELAQAEHERLPFELVEQIVQLSIEDYLREQDDHEGQQHTRKNNERYLDVNIAIVIAEAVSPR